MASPTVQFFPQSEAELREKITRTKGQIRVRGTGHSFTPICATDDTMVSLEHLPGDLLDHRQEGDEHIVRLQAGASLKAVSGALQKKDLAFKNLGDIDVQSVAGAAMTATHGTGQSLPCLAGEMRSMRMVTASGDVIKASAESDPALLDAARVSLGALGILTEVEMSVRPAFKLHRRSRVRPVKDLMAEAHGIWDTNRNFEFFVIPFCDYALELTHNETDAPDMQQNVGDDEAALGQLRLLRNVAKRMPGLRRMLLNLFSRSTKPEEEIGRSYELLASVRSTLFNEMEYHLPPDRAMEALDEVVHLIERSGPDVFFPIEVRKTAADTGWLSPFGGAARVSIAVHAHQPDDYAWFFETLEPVFKRYQGRPHWGKLHALGAAELSELYPKFGAFQRLRAELDPSGRLLNFHLAKLFGVNL